MLPNQVNFRELFSNPGAYLAANRTDHYDSQSNSQLPYSQVDFPDSQEQSSQNSLSNSPRKRFYSRYGNSNKGLSKHNSQENLRSHLSSAVKLTNQQLQNNIARAKDRDERDLLNSILGSIRESSAEVLTAVAVVRDNVQQNDRATDGQLESCFNKIHETIAICNKEVMKAVEIKDKHKDELSKMRQELLGKATKIADLENQLEATREETNNKLIDKLTKISETHHKKTQDKIKELYSIHKQDLKEFAEKQHQNQVTGLKDTQQHLKELGKMQEIQLKDNNTKLGQKFQQISQQSKSMNDKLTKDIKETIKTIQKQFKVEVDKLVEKQYKLLSSSKPMTVNSDDHKHEVYRLLEDYKVDLSIKVSEQLDALLVHHEETLTDVIKDCLLAEKTHTEQKYLEMQENIQQRIEDEIKKLETSHKEQLDKVMARLKTLAPPTTPKIPPILIPPPTPEQFKEQLSLPMQPTTVQSPRVLRSARIAAQSKATSSATSEQPVTSTRNTAVQPLSTNIPPVAPLKTSFSALSTVPATAYVSPSLISKSIFQNSVFSERYTSGVYSSPVATVLPQLHIDKPLKFGGSKSPYALTGGCGKLIPPGPALPEPASPDPASPDPASSEPASSEPASPEPQQASPGPPSPGPPSLHSEPQSPEPMSQHSEPPLLNSEYQYISEPVDYHRDNDKQEPRPMEDKYDETNKPPQKVKPTRKPKRAKRRKKLLPKKKKRAAARVPVESHMVPVNNTDDEVIEEPETQPEFQWEPPSRNVLQGRSRKRKKTAANILYNPIPSQEQKTLPPIRGNKKGIQQNNQRQRQESNTMRQMKQNNSSRIGEDNLMSREARCTAPPAIGHKQRYGQTDTQNFSHQNSTLSMPENDGYSFGRTYQNVYSQDIRPYDQPMGSYQPPERPLPPQSYQNHTSWSRHSVQPSNIAPHMRSYSYSYSASMPPRGANDMYEFNGDDSPLIERNQLTYNGSAWKRPKTVQQDQSRSSKSKAKSHCEKPDARWQVACQIQGPPKQQQYTSEPFEDLAMIPYENLSDQDENSDDNQNEQEDYSHSRESSPSMSVTEVFIKRKFRQRTKTPEQRQAWDMQSDDSQNETQNDFLSNATYQHNNQTNSKYSQKQMANQDGKMNQAPGQKAAESTNVVTTEVVSMKRSFRHRNGRK